MSRWHRRLNTHTMRGVKLENGHEVVVRKRSNPHSLGKTWMAKYELRLQYDPKTRTVSGGDFSEEEIRQMEQLYGAPIRRSA